MKIRTHYHIAKIAWEQMESQHTRGFLRKMAFCIGAMLPDFEPAQFIHPHFYEASAAYVSRRMTTLCFKIRGKMSFFRTLKLGRLAHYLSDFCCYAHRAGRLCQVKQHIIYERQMNQFMLQYKELFTLAPEKEKISAVLRHYRQSTAHQQVSYTFDLENAIQICAALLNKAVDRYRSPVSGKSATTVLPAFSGRKPY